MEVKAIQFRLPVKTANAFKEVARSRGVTQTALMRQLIEYAVNQGARREDYLFLLPWEITPQRGLMGPMNER